MPGQSCVSRAVQPFSPSLPAPGGRSVPSSRYCGPRCAIPRLKRIPRPPAGPPPAESSTEVVAHETWYKGSHPESGGRPPGCGPLGTARGPGGPGRPRRRFGSEAAGRLRFQEWQGVHDGPGEALGRGCRREGQGVDLGPARNKKEMLAILRDYVQAHPEKKAYLGFNWTFVTFAGDDGTRHDLDAICRDKPVVLFKEDNHDTWFNTKAMELAGFTRDSKDPMPDLSYYRREPDGVNARECAGRAQAPATLLSTSLLTFPELGLRGRAPRGTGSTARVSGWPRSGPPRRSWAVLRPPLQAADQALRRATGLRQRGISSRRGGGSSPWAGRVAEAGREGLESRSAGRTRSGLAGRTRRPPPQRRRRPGR